MVNRKFFFIIFFSVFFVDRIIKELVRIFSVSTSNGIVDITYTTNVGSLFSLFSSVSYINIVFIIVSILALAALLFVVFKEDNKRLAIPLGLLAGGVLGNLFDRIVYGSVIDWINFHFWPVFNIADAALVVGVFYALFIITEFV